MKDILKRWTFKKDRGWWLTEKRLKVLNNCEAWLTFKKIPEQLRSCLRKEQDRAQQGSSTDLVYVFSCVIKQQVFVRMLSRPKDFMKKPEQTLRGLHENMQFHSKIKFASLNWNCNEWSWRSKLKEKYYTYCWSDAAVWKEKHRASFAGVFIS